MRMAKSNFTFMCGNHLCDATYQYCEEDSCLNCTGFCTETRIGGLPEKRDYCMKKCAIFMYNRLSSEEQSDCKNEKIGLGFLAIVIVVLLCVIIFLVCRKKRTPREAVNQGQNGGITTDQRNQEESQVLQIENDPNSAEQEGETIPLNNIPCQAVQNEDEHHVIKNPSFPVDCNSKLVTNAEGSQLLLK